MKLRDYVKEYCKENKITSGQFSKKAKVSAMDYCYKAGCNLAFKTVYIIFKLLGLENKTIKEAYKILKGGKNEKN